MASRRLRETGTDFDGRVVDHGASYFTVRDADFTEVVNSLIDRGIVRPWTDTFHVYSEGAVSSVRTGPMRYAATGGLRTVVETLAEDVTHIECDRHVDRVEIAAHAVSVEGQRASSLALCMPQPQAERIVPPGVLPDVGITWEPVIAVTMIYAAFRVVTTANVVHAALWLVVVLAGVAVQFLFLGAEFVAVTQVLVYIGAVIVLFLFGVMLTRASMGDDETVAGEKRAMAAIVGVLLFAVMAMALVDSFEDTRVDIDQPQGVTEVSDAIFSQYIVPFEAVSVLQLAALIGAIVVARKD